jgi:DNA-binding Xre family transcriptional regulator
MSKVIRSLNFLVETLHKRGWNNTQITNELGINRRTLYRWTCGEIKTPRIALLALELLVSRK